MQINLYNDDCLKILKTFADNSIDAIVTDPPYGIKFMGKKWDYNIPSVEIWQECLRVLNPGGHILVACGTRTQHRMACNIEDAGFEIRDLIAYLYGSGFPKSLNIGKAVDKLQGNNRKILGENKHPTSKDRSGDKSPFQSNDSHLSSNFILTKGSSEWEGWGTGLKPAMELWTLARKPLLEKTVANNVLKWGVGGLNIDGGRIETEDKTQRNNRGVEWGVRNDKSDNEENIFGSELGRFPANVIHDGSEEVLELFPETSPSVKSERGKVEIFKKENSWIGDSTVRGHNDDGSAARFFYCAKASNAERNEGCEDLDDVLLARSGGAQQAEKEGKEGKEEYLQQHIGLNKISKVKNNHPTVKPIELMKYLCRLITPKNGIVLDPFMGSGSTGIAAKMENFNFIGIEIDNGYFKIAETRINNKEVVSLLI